MKSVGMAARLRAIAVGIAASMTLLTAAQAASQIDNTALSNEADGTNWAANGRTFIEQHFSPLTQINTHTIGKLGLAWTLDFDDVCHMPTLPIAVSAASSAAAGSSVIPAADVGTGQLMWTTDTPVAHRTM